MIICTARHRDHNLQVLTTQQPIADAAHHRHRKISPKHQPKRLSVMVTDTKKTEPAVKHPRETTGRNVRRDLIEPAGETASRAGVRV